MQFKIITLSNFIFAKSYSAALYSAKSYSAVLYSAKSYSAVLYSAKSYSAVLYSAKSNSAILYSAKSYSGVGCRVVFGKVAFGYSFEGHGGLVGRLFENIEKEIS